MRAPWNASWSAEDRYEVRPCRYAGGALALWSPHAPGQGRPIFAKPHMVRQRRSIREMRCTVCGERTPPNDRWWFGLGAMTEGMFMSTEAPVHRRCADLAQRICPHLQKLDADPTRFPGGYDIAFALVGGLAVDRDFGITIPPTARVIGHLKFAWPLARLSGSPAGNGGTP